jgi:hypothetical protein
MGVLVRSPLVNRGDEKKCHDAIKGEQAEGFCLFTPEKAIMQIIHGLSAP